MKCKSLLSCLVLIGLLSAISCGDFGLSNVFKSTVDVTSGVAKDVTNKLPTPKGLFETSKQVIAGYPFEFVSSSVNKICKCFKTTIKRVKSVLEFLYFETPKNFV